MSRILFANFAAVKHLDALSPTCCVAGALCLTSRHFLAISDARVCGAYAFVAVCDMSLGFLLRCAKYMMPMPTHVFLPKLLFWP